MATALTIIQDCSKEIGIASPLTVFGSTDTTVLQMAALLTREGKELAARTSNNEGWPSLRALHQFDLTVVTGLTGTLTADSAVITGISSTASLLAGYGALGSGIPASVHILTVDSGTQITLDRPVTTSGSAVALTFGKDKYAFPSDLQYFINRTGWDRTSKWELVGPMMATEWQFLESGYPATGFLYRFRVMTDKLVLHPIPETTARISMEYYSKNWCQSAGGTGQAAFAADTDTPILDDFLLTLGLKWRFLRAKGLDYAQEQRTYEDAVERSLARAGTGRDLPLNASAGRVNRLIDFGNVPDSGFGS